MRKLLFIALAFSYILKIHAQNPTFADCLGAIPVCQSVYVNPNQNYGPGNYINEIYVQQTCFSGISNQSTETWFYLENEVEGWLGFNIIPNNSSTDYDWMVFNISQLTCEQLRVANISDLILSCNWNSTYGITGANDGTNPQDNSRIWLAVNRQTLVYVNNFSNNTQPFNIDFSISSFNPADQTAPRIADAFNYSLGPEYVLVRFSENVLCSTITANNFKIKDSNQTEINAIDIYGTLCGNTPFSRDFLVKFETPLVNPMNYELRYNGQVSDQCGNVSQPNLLFNLNSTVSIDQLNENKRLIYPNPSQDKVFLEGQHGDKVEITDVSGKLIFSKIVETEKTEINVEQWNAGVYIVKYTNSNNTTIRKLIKN